jgi:hypothetical protein
MQPRKVITRGLAGLAALGASLGAAVCLSGSAGAAPIATAPSGPTGNCHGLPSVGVFCLQEAGVPGHHAFQAVGTYVTPGTCWTMELFGPTSNTYIGRTSGCEPVAKLGYTITGPMDRGRYRAVLFVPGHPQLNLKTSVVVTGS